MSKRKNNLVVHAVLLIVGLIIIFPFIWSISLSFERLYTNSLPIPPRFLPLKPTLFNYMVALKNMNVFKYAMNTAYIGFMGTILSLFFNTMAAFALSKGTFRFKNVIMIYLLTTMMIPGEVRIMSMFGIIKGMHLLNTYTAAFLPAVVCGGFTIFFIKNYIDVLPDSLYESAVIEGASLFRIYSSIFLPLMKAVIIANMILGFIGLWNDFLWPLVVLGSDQKRTLTLAMAAFQGNSTSGIHPGVAMSISLMSTIPLFILFIFLQKHIVQSIAFSGIKE